MEEISKKDKQDKKAGTGEGNDFELMEYWELHGPSRKPEKEGVITAN